MKKLLSGLISLLACIFFIDIFGAELNALERAGRLVLLLFYVTSGLLIMQINLTDRDDFQQELILTAGCMGGMFLIFGVNFIPFPLHASIWAFTTLVLFNFVRNRSVVTEHRPLTDPPHPHREIDIRA